MIERLAILAILTACGPAGEPPQVAFERVEIDVGADPHVLAAELTGDDHPDLAVAGEDRVLILAGDGEGGFRRTGEFAAGERPTGLAAADLDGDGDPDLAAANHETDYLTILLNDGAGAFSPAPGSPLGIDVDPHPHVVAVADLDADDHPDLLVDHRSAEGLLPLYGTGDGTFEAGSVVELGGDPYRGIVVTDLDGDGIPDLAVPNQRTVGVRPGLTGREFGPLEELDVAAVAPYGLVAADVTGDGLPDLAASSGEGGEGVAVLLNDGSGNLGSAPDAPHPAFRGFTAVSAGDLDADGRDDIVVSGWDAGEVAILYGGSADGTDGRDAPSPRLQRVAVGENPWSVSTADFDGDGRDDVAVAVQGEDRVVVLLSRSL